MESGSDVTRMRLVGGDLALDFVNTRGGPPAGPADDDALTEYADLLAWGVYAGGLDEHASAALSRLARRDPDGADAAYRRSLETREYLDDVFRTLAAGRRPSPVALARLRDAEADAVAHAVLAAASPYAWTWQDDRTLVRPLRPVVHAAVQLLTAAELDRIRACDGCRFLFYDVSKNRSRRWCSMDDCGTTEKVRRYVAARRMRATPPAHR